MYVKLFCCRYCTTCMYLSASRTLAADRRRHYQHKMLSCVDNTLGKCAVDVCSDQRQYAVL